MAPGSRVGTQFGPYRLEKLVGRGGMGEVYEAYDTSKDRRVAVKLLHPELGRDPSYKERFRRESHAAARLQEPHVIPIHDWGEIDGVLYIDMRLVHGTDLRTLIKTGGPLAPARAVGIIAQIASALESAHQDGLVHRDIKPENILVAREDFAYLVDFGIAQSESDGKLTATGSAIGSYSYMAPERFEDKPVSGRADIYSLACVLYECLVGAVPFPATSISSAVRLHLMEAPPKPSIVRQGVPRAFDAVIATGMAKDPGRRYSTPGDLARAAHQALTAVEQSAATEIAHRAAPPSSAPPTVARGAVLPGFPQPPSIPHRTYPESTPFVPPQPMGFAQPQGYGQPQGFVQAQPQRRHPPPQHKSSAVPVLITLLVVGLLVLGGVVVWLLLRDTESGPGPTIFTTTDDTQTFSTTTSDAETTTVAPTTQPMNGFVSGTDDQGFLSPASARCNSTNQAVAIGRTASSLIVICQTGVGRYYYKGTRISDGAGITLDDPVQSGSGWLVVNPTDGTRYRVNSTSLTISRDGETLASETMLEYAYR